MVDHGHYIAQPLPEGEMVRTVAEGSVFRQVHVLRPGSTDIPFRHIIAQRDSVTDICVIIMPGVDANVEISVDIVGEGAKVDLSGIYICGSEEKASFRTELHHRCGGSVSNQIINGIAAGNAHTGFYGRIVVAPDAQKTEAYQSNHNVLVSETAKVDTKPQLEIYADDVKCSHGATIGSLNPDEQFYMRSRGITEQEAKVLQMISFVAPVLAHIDDEELRASVSEEVEASIRTIVR